MAIISARYHYLIVHSCSFCAVDKKAINIRMCINFVMLRR